MLISKNTNTDFFTVNGTANASECGVFNDLYDVIGPKSKQEFCSLLVDEYGAFNLYDFAPNIREDEVYNFLNKPCRIYRNELSNGVITTSLRGITNTDFVHLPNTSLVDLRRVIPEGQQVKSFLVDTATDKIKGIRIVELSDKTISQLLKDWITMENSGISSSEIFETLQEKVYCYSSDVFMKRSTYVGRDVSSMVPSSLFISPPTE